MITHNYTLLCDDFRMEMNGKFIIIGLLPNGLSTPQIPFPVPGITFFQSLQADSIGTFKFKASLAQLDSGAVLASVEGPLHVQIIAPVVLPIRIPPVQFMAFGSYTWSLEIDGQEPFLTEFKVSHTPGHQMRAVPFAGR